MSAVGDPSVDGMSAVGDSLDVGEVVLVDSSALVASVVESGGEVTMLVLSGQAVNAMAPVKVH